MNKNSIRKVLLTFVITFICCIFIYKFVGDSHVKKQELLNLAIVNEDSGQKDLNLGRAFINKLERDQTLELNVTNRSDLDKGLNSGYYDIGLIIPNNFTQNSVDINYLNTKSEIKYLYKSDAGVVETKEYDYRVEGLDKDFNSNIIEVYLRNITKDVTNSQKQIKKNSKTTTKLTKKITENTKGLSQNSKDTKQIDDNLKDALEYAQALVKTTKDFVDSSDKLNDLSNGILDLSLVLYDFSETNQKEIGAFNTKTNEFNDEAKIVEQNFLSKLIEVYTNVDDSYKNVRNSILENDSGFKAKYLLMAENETLTDIDFTGNINDIYNGLITQTIYEKSKTPGEHDGLTEVVYRDFLGSRSATMKNYFIDEIQKVYEIHTNWLKANYADSADVKTALYRINRACSRMSKPAAPDDNEFTRICPVVAEQTYHPKSGAAAVSLIVLDNRTQFENYIRDVIPGATIAGLDANSDSLDTMKQYLAGLLMNNVDIDFSKDIFNPNLTGVYVNDSSVTINGIDARLINSIQDNAIYAEDIEQLTKSLKSNQDLLVQFKGNAKSFFDNFEKNDDVDMNSKITVLGNINTGTYDVMFGKDEKIGWLKTFAENAVTTLNIYNNKKKETTDLKQINDEQKVLKSDMSDNNKTLKAHNKETVAREKSVSSQNKLINKLVSSIKDNIKTMNTNTNDLTKYVKYEQKFVKTFGTVLKNAKNGDSYNEDFFDYAKNPILFNAMEEQNENTLVYPALITLLVAFASLLTVLFNRRYKPNLTQNMLETNEHFMARINRSRLNYLLIIAGVQAALITIVSYLLFKIIGNNIMIWFVAIACAMFILTIFFDLLISKFKIAGVVVISVLAIFYIYANNLILLTTNHSVTNTIASFTPFGLIEQLLRYMLFDNNIFIGLVCLAIALIIGIILYAINTTKKTKGEIAYE